MKSLFLALAFITISYLSTNAQPNPCSVLKSANTILTNQTNPENIQGDLMDKYDVKFYHLNLNVERTSTFISGWVRTMALVTSPIDSFAFELYNTLTIDSVFSGTTKLVISHPGNFGFAKFPATVTSGNMIDMKIYYHGTPPNGGGAAIGSGFTNKTDATSGISVTFSLSQPYSATEWWPCKQSLKDKIDSVYVYVTTDSTNRVGSNGLLKNTVIVGNKKRYEWKQIFPIDCYLISVAVSKYIDYSFYANPVNTPPILVQNYIYDHPATITAMKTAFNQTKPIIELYCKLFGPYAFAAEKYGHCMAQLGGGMEHQTMTTLGNYSYEVIAHELGHQWFGDAVTCATWSDIWVNEGFATYTAYLALQYLDTVNAPAYMTNSHNTVTGLPDGSIWFTDTANVGRIFSNRLTYQKGSSVIHMIRFELNNDTLFFNILKEYIRRFKGSTASALDFKKVVEDLSGKDFTLFFNQWFYGEGFPYINIYWNQVGTRLSILNTQATSMPSSINLFITPLELKIKTTKGDTTIRVFVKNNVSNYLLTIKDTVLSIQVDPSNWLLCKTFSIKDTSVKAFGISSFGDKNEIVVYPNPAKDIITIRSNTIPDHVSYTITDALGQVVINGYLDNKTTSVDTRSLNAGFYFVKIEGTKPETFKLIKK